MLPYLRSEIIDPQIQRSFVYHLVAATCWVPKSGDIGPSTKVLYAKFQQEAKNVTLGLGALLACVVELSIKSILWVQHA